MAELTFQEEDYPINKQLLNNLLCLVTEATGYLEADKWAQEKLQSFSNLISSYSGRWQ